MKPQKEILTKTVEYMGYEYEVPDWAKFIATDEDGDIYVYEMMPEPREDDVLGFWGRGMNNGRVMRVGSHGWNWQETLVEIKE